LNEIKPNKGHCYLVVVVISLLAISTLSITQNASAAITKNITSTLATENNSPDTSSDTSGFSPTLSLQTRSNTTAEETPSSDTSSNAGQSLKVSAKAAEDPITNGDSQTIIVTVTDQNGNAVKNARISATIVHTHQEISRNTFSGTTDQNGGWSFSMQISGNAAGTIGVDVKAKKDGYDTGYGSAFFGVMPSKK